MTGRFDRPGLLAAVTGAAVLDGTAQVITAVVTHATARAEAAAAPRPDQRTGQRLVAARRDAD